jgi:hypothetical protein
LKFFVETLAGNRDMNPHPVNSPIQLSFHYRESDYVRAVRTHLYSRLRLDIAVIIVVAGLGILSWKSSGPRWLSMAEVAVALGFAVFLFAGFTIIPSIAFRLEPKFRDDYSLNFSEEGIHFRTSHLDSHLDWAMYSRALIDANSYILYYGSRHFTVIPTRAFENAEQRQAFDRLVTAHVPEIVRREK